MMCELPACGHEVDKSDENGVQTEVGAKRCHWTGSCRARCEDAEEIFAENTDAEFVQSTKVTFLKFTAAHGNSCVKVVETHKHVGT